MLSRKEKVKTSYLILVIPIAALFVFFIINVNSKSSDSDYFNQLDSNLNTIANKLKKNNDSIIKVDSKSICHNSEQGPWDNGNLWCYVNQAYYLEVENSKIADQKAQELIDHIEVELKAIGFEGDTGSTSRGYDDIRLILKPSGQMRDSRGVCNFTLRYPSKAHVTYYLPQHYESDKEIQFILSCGSRSSTAVFENIN